MFSPSQPVEYSPGLYSANFILEIDASETTQSGSGGLLEVIDHPEITFSDDSFEISAGGFEQRNITIYGMSNNTRYTVTASMTIGCFETTATLDIVVGVLPFGIIYVNVDDSWKSGTIYVNDNGTWKPGNVYVKVNGSWQLSRS